MFRSRRRLAVWCLLALVFAPAGADAQLNVRLAAAADSFVALGQTGSIASPWGDFSDQARLALARRQDDLAAALRGIDLSTLQSPADHLLYATLSEVNDARRETRICRSHLWAGITPFSGWQNNAAGFAKNARVGNDTARRAAIDAFNTLPAAIRVQRDLLQRGLDSGFTAARPVMAVVVRQLEDLMPEEVTASPLWSPAQRDSDVVFRAAWRALLKDSIAPAIHSFRNYLRDEYLPRARAEGAMVAQRDGAACYAAELRARTSVRADVDSLMRDARREYDRVALELGPLASRLTGERNLGRAVILLRTDPRFTYASRDSVLAAYRALTSLAEARFGRVVAGFAPESLVVIPYDAFQENAGAPPTYQRATGGNRQPARFMVNLARNERMMVANAVAHEAYPGHHLQRLAEIRAPAIHPVMRSLTVNGFVEGWGIYSEYLGEEMGLYTSAVDSAGYLVHLLDVALGMYLDVGFHAKGWTRQNLIDSMVILGGRPPAMAAPYADRHAATPGQLPTYYVGYRAIRAAREYASRELGAAFQAPEFHAVVLNDGPITLAAMRDKVDRWVRDQARARDRRRSTR